VNVPITSVTVSTNREGGCSVAKVTTGVYAYIAQIT
jgi:hypothetical protein